MSEEALARYGDKGSGMYEAARRRVVSGVSFLVLGLMSVMTGMARGQAIPTATRTAGISIFGGYSHVRTDYGSPGSGFLFGVDATRPFRFVNASAELRFSHATGGAVSEDTDEFGMKLAPRYGPFQQFRPYGEVQAGYGVIHYKHDPAPGYTHDNSAFYALGGGVDYGLTTHFAVKGDFQYEFWNLGSETSGLTPYAISVGVVYSIPFHAYRGRRY